MEKYNSIRGIIGGKLVRALVALNELRKWTIVDEGMLICPQV